jgi:hypothetical protein
VRKRASLCGEEEEWGRTAEGYACRRATSQPDTKSRRTGGGRSRR